MRCRCWLLARAAEAAAVAVAAAARLRLWLRLFASFCDSPTATVTAIATAAEPVHYSCCMLCTGSTMTYNVLEYKHLTNMIAVIVLVFMPVEL